MRADSKTNFSLLANQEMIYGHKIMQKEKWYEKKIVTCSCGTEIIQVNGKKCTVFVPRVKTTRFTDTILS